MLGPIFSSILSLLLQSSHAHLYLCVYMKMRIFLRMSVREKSLSLFPLSAFLSIYIYCNFFLHFLELRRVLQGARCFVYARWEKWWTCFREGFGLRARLIAFGALATHILTHLRKIEPAFTRVLNFYCCFSCFFTFVFPHSFFVAVVHIHLNMILFIFIFVTRHALSISGGHCRCYDVVRDQLNFVYFKLIIQAIFQSNSSRPRGETRLEDQEKKFDVHTSTKLS